MSHPLPSLATKGSLGEAGGITALSDTLVKHKHRPTTAAERPVGAHYFDDVYVNGLTGSDSYDGSSAIVQGNGVGPKKTIQAGINVAYTYGTVHVAPGVYRENLVIDTGIYLEGAGARDTIIDGGYEDTVINITAYYYDIDLDGFTIRNGDGYWGGGIVNGWYCWLYVWHCAIIDNVGYVAGGIYNEDCDLYLIDSVVSGNIAYEVGGGILNYDSYFVMLNSTVSSNSIGQGGYWGGGIYSEDCWNAVIFSTIANNSATGSPTSKGGGFADYDSWWQFYSTIVAGNRASTAGTNNAFFYYSYIYHFYDFYCIDSENTCHFIDPTSQVNTDPHLGPLKDNGGDTCTHAITIDSPAFDRGGSVFIFPWDQRDVSRPQGAACDVGAFELEVTASGNVNAQGPAGPEPIYFSTSAGGIFDLQALPRTSCAGTLTEGMVMPYGLFSFRIAGIAPGATVRITIKFPRVIPATFKYFKCSGTGQMTDVTSLVTHNPGDDFIVLTLTDGGPGDLDGAVNGRITDPGGPAWVVNAVPQSSSAYIAPPQKTVGLPSLMVQSAVLSSAEVQPGQPVSVTATVANRGDAGGAMKLALTVNGEQEAVQGVAVNSGGTSQVSFTVSRDEPGTYSVYVGGTYAGEFTVSPSIDPTMVLVISLIMVCTSLVLGVVMLRRRQNAGG